MPGITKNIKREHRTVCLPDYQGVGIGNAVSALIGAICKGVGLRFRSTTTNPAMIRTRNASSDWRMTRVPEINLPQQNAAKMRWAINNRRIITTFEYVGAPMPHAQAAQLLGFAPKRIEVIGHGKKQGKTAAKFTQKREKGGRQTRHKPEQSRQPATVQIH